MIIKKLPFILLPLVLAFGSCIPNKKIVYLQDINEKVDSLYQVQLSNYHFQKGDIIAIDVKLASDNPILANIFQSAQNQNLQVASQGAGDFYYLTGFVLNDSGYVNLPVIGKIKLDGLNIFEANERVQKTFDEYLTNVFVTVRFGGLRFSVLGEVRRPGKFLVLQNRMTIFEAMATAGDMTDLAKRDAVVVMRQYPDGTRIHKINMLDESVISSPYYYIQPNDVIYVEPLKIRALGTGTNGMQSLQAILTVFAILSTTVTLIQLGK